MVEAWPFGPCPPQECLLGVAHAARFKARHSRCPPPCHGEGNRSAKHLPVGCRSKRPPLPGGRTGVGVRPEGLRVGADVKPFFFHILLRSGSEELSTTMRRLLTGYAVRFNGLTGGTNVGGICFRTATNRFWSRRIRTCWNSCATFI